MKLTKKEKEILAESVIMDKSEWENLKEIISDHDLEMYDEVRIRLTQCKGKITGHISGYIEPEPPDDLEEDFQL
jgi:hypothetical protein